jgi:hypothetical protein
MRKRRIIVMARPRRRRKPFRYATSHDVLQHIGRVHFNNQRVFIYHIRFLSGVQYRVLYDWLRKTSDYKHFHPELAGLDCSFAASPQRIVGAIHGGVTRDGKPRQFSVKPMIRVMRTQLTIWEDSGAYIFERGVLWRACFNICRRPQATATRTAIWN